MLLNKIKNLPIWIKITALLLVLAIIVSVVLIVSPDSKEKSQTKADFSNSSQDSNKTEPEKEIDSSALIDDNATEISSIVSSSQSNETITSSVVSNTSTSEITSKASNPSVSSIPSQPSVNTGSSAESSSSVRGNTYGNIYNSQGKAAISGDWIYYVNDEENDALYKMKTDGTQKMRLGKSEQCDNINIVGDWIYYSYYADFPMTGRIRTDGTSQGVLFFGFTYYMSVIGDNIYYCTNNVNITPYGEYDFCIYNISTKQKTVMDDDDYYIPYVTDDGWVYYLSSANDPAQRLYKMRLDGTQKTKISDELVNYFDIKDGWIYYLDFYFSLCKMRLDGSDKIVLDDTYPENFIISGDWIYVDKGGLYKIKLDGSDLTQLTEDGCAELRVVGDWIIYENTSQKYKDYIIRTDGTENRKLN